MNKLINKKLIIAMGLLIASPTIATAETIAQFQANGQLTTADGDYTIVYQSYSSQDGNPTIDTVTFTDTADGSAAPVTFYAGQNAFITTLNYEFISNINSVVTSIQVTNNNRDNLSTSVYNAYNNQLIGTLINNINTAAPSPLSTPNLNQLIIDNYAVSQTAQHDTPYTNTFNLQAVSVPLPSAATLFLSGLLGFGMQVKRKSGLFKPASV